MYFKNAYSCSTLIPKNKSIFPTHYCFPSSSAAETKTKVFFKTLSAPNPSVTRTCCTRLSYPSPSFMKPPFLSSSFSSGVYPLPRTQISQTPAKRHHSLAPTTVFPYISQKHHKASHRILSSSLTRCIATLQSLPTTFSFLTAFFNAQRRCSLILYQKRPSPADLISLFYKGAPLLFSQSN